MLSCLRMIMYNQDYHSFETLNLSIIILTLLIIGQTDDSLAKNDKVTPKNYTGKNLKVSNG